MPVLYLLAGPNGSGKTTFYDYAISNGFIDAGLPFLNVDLITKGFGGYTDENYARQTIFIVKKLGNTLTMARVS